MASDVLKSIVDNKKREVRFRQGLKSISTLRSNCEPSQKSFFDALNNNHSDFIFECKKASPSKGLIRKHFDLDEILDQYENYASAISVLTDNKYFQGSFAHLQKVTSRVKQPVICKDFFIDSYQIVEARHYGADAILLMLSVLSDEEYKRLAIEAEKYQMDILTEVHTSDELKRAIRLEAKIIGINNRNLKDLSINLETTKTLVREFASIIKQNPLNYTPLLISESGIQTHLDVKQLSPFVDGFLIGSSIMADGDIAKRCKALIYGQTKICGLTKPDDAIAATKSGAIYGGLIFHPKSPRFVELDQAKSIVKTEALQFVGVFVDSPIEQVVQYAKELKLKVIQLHGNENDAYTESLRNELQRAEIKCEIWKAFGVTEESDSVSLNQRISATLADKALLDTQFEGKKGGNGKSFDWTLLSNTTKEKIILAGGLSKENIEQAKVLGCYALDINSGVELAPGKKSPEKITEIYRLIRN